MHTCTQTRKIVKVSVYVFHLYKSQEAQNWWSENCVKTHTHTHTHTQSMYSSLNKLDLKQLNNI